MRTTSPVESVLGGGTAAVAVPVEVSVAIRDLFAAAHEFFASDARERSSIAAVSSMSGWRRIGVEYSQSPDRPDLNETFCFRRADAHRLAPHPLVQAAATAQALLDDVAGDVLAEIGALTTGTRRTVRTADESWLQLNYSTPSSVQRDYIQEAHEDGHLLTFLVADAPGLEVHEPATGWRAVQPSFDAPICFGGECGALLTADAVSPTPHRVRAHPSVAIRLSMAYFVNPDLDQDLPPWLENERNVGVDLLRWGQQNPARFGLPVL